MTQTKSRKSQAWLAPAILCIVCWGLWGLLVKVGSAAATPEQLQVLFTLGMLPLALFMLFRIRFRLDSDRAGVIYGVLNGVLTGLGLLAYYAAMQRGKASVVGPVTVNVHGVIPDCTQALAHPSKVLPALGAAVNVTVVPTG